MNSNRFYANLTSCALTLGVLSITGCRYFPESTFELANDSRPPKWIAIPPSADRKKIKLTMSYYAKAWGDTALFTLKDENEHVLQRVGGKACGTFRLAGANEQNGLSYPAYQAVVVKNTTEIVEHRAMEPIFRITDAPAVWQRYSAIGCK